MVHLPGVEGSHHAVLLNQLGSASHGNGLPGLVLPLLHGQAEAAVLQSPCRLLQHCLAAALPVGSALPRQQHGVAITLEAKRCSHANLQANASRVNFIPYCLDEMNDKTTLASSPFDR